MSICPYVKRKTALRLNNVRIRLIEPFENEEWNALLEKHHYLSNGIMVGPQLRYVAEIGSKAVGLIGFSNASYHLFARDNWIGWNDIQRDRRLGFVVQNSRFLILPDAHRKNMASKILSLCAKRIGNDWERLFDHPVLILETFTGLNKERRGTGYLAAGWERVGETKGYTRDRRNFYTKSGMWRDPVTKRYKTPSYVTVWRAIASTDPMEFERRILSWFNKEMGGGVRLVHIDGKSLRATMDEQQNGLHVVSAASFEDFFCGKP